ncbi:hypothetical protein EV121DRAFT_259339 [Schizophyllum commune]
MRAFTIASVAAALVASVSAHMEMTSPPPLRSKANKNAGQNIDYSMTAPLEADGSNFPCKGYLDDTEGKESVATWQAGSSQQITITGGANHGGGSCQLSISEDEGKTFKVIKSFEGACPANLGDNTLNVDIPTDVKNGDVVFAWTWNNEIGNREFYMNCAMVTIENGGSGLDSYPDMFVAQLSSINSCTIAEGIDVKYPNPGDQVETADGAKLGDPTGDCGATGSTSGGSSGGSASSSAGGAGGAGATGASSAGGAGASASVSIGIGGGSGSAPTSAAGASSAAASATGVNNGGDGGVGDLSSALGGASSAVGGAGASATSAASGSSATGAAGSSGSTGGASGASGAAGSSATGAAGGASSTGSASGAAGSAVPCDNEGETRCDSTTTWSVCGSGIWQNMGSTAAGMKCVNGSMELDSDSAASSSPVASARALREARSFVSHKRHWKSRRHA